MELFIKIYFWMSLVGVVLRILFVGYYTYPRSMSRGDDVINLLVGIPFLVWAAYLVLG